MINQFIRPISKALNTCVIIFIFFTCSAYAGGYDETEALHFDAAAYLWGAQVTGTTANGQPIKLTFKEILKDLRFGYMGAFRARKGKWSFVSDVIYLDLKANKSSTIPVPYNSQVIAVFGNADVILTGWILNFNGAYNFVENNRYTFNVLGGARYLELNAQSNLRFDALGYTKPISVDLSGRNWNAIGGVKGLVKLNEQWSIPYYVDAGTGQSKFTWQAYSGLSYAVSWGSIDLLYRYESWKFKQNSSLRDINLGGLLLGAVYKFQ